MAEFKDKNLSRLLEQQAATNAILDVISNSTGDLQPVFEMIARSAKRICHARFCAVFQVKNELIHLVSSKGISASGLKAYKKDFPRIPSRESAIGRAIMTGKVEHIADVSSDHNYDSILMQSINFRSIVAVPILYNDQPVGGIALLRSVAKPFSDEEIEILQTFAEQASIAIGNAQLIMQISVSNRELSEALAYQTALARVLRHIASSPVELQPVFDMISQSGRELFQGEFSGVFQYDGKLIHLVGYDGLTSKGIKEYQKLLPRPPGPELAIGRSILERKVVHIEDVEKDASHATHLLARISKMRTLVAVPMLRENRPVGGIVVWRSVVKPFSEQQIELLKTFADQALIAIEGVRLFRKVNRQLHIIREVFGKYVPENVVESIVTGRGNIEPVQTTATILYSDLEDFTGIVESMAPDRVVQMLNEYFPAVIEPIERHSGVVNQFQGDAMLVTFNVPVENPSHADQAVAAAAEIQEVVRSRKFAGVSLRTRIGINTGDVIAGNVGSGDRINYTVHGDAVNIAARLEQLNKKYGTRILVSENTVSRLRQSFPLSYIGQVSIRGKHGRVKIYQLKI